MKIRSGRFVTSLDQLKSFPGRGLPEIALVGKSNVGKSSMINRLAGNSKLARTSSEPGKTRLINMYLINEEFFFADLPGYGFAKAPRDEKAKWGRMIEGYLSGSNQLKFALQLVDIRHNPTADDVMMVNYLRHYNIPFIVVATKADKVSGAKRGPSVMNICRGLQVQPWQVYPFSSENGFGMDKLVTRIGQALGEKPVEIEETAEDEIEAEE
ncbi:MAG: YihA family ribosome biogenesis GTP-binding protein [Clostridia bacterium]|nr:YihA family ribosome biogenesis GTP-binding protein [Clostridia bacterium]